MKIFKRLPRDGGYDFLLCGHVLRQVSPNLDFPWWRQVKRSQLRKLFQQVRPRMKYSTVLALAGKTNNNEWWIPNQWVALVYGFSTGKDIEGTLKIGCQRFNKKETRAIKRWALAK